MSEINAGDGKPAQTNQPHAEKPPATEGGEKKFLTADEAKQFFQEALNPLAAKIRALEQVKPVEKTATPEKERALEDRLRELEEKERRNNARRKSVEIQKAALASEVIPERMEILVGHIEQKFGSRISYDENADAVAVSDEFDRKTPISDFLKTFLASPAGEMFRRPVSTPNGASGGAAKPTDKPKVKLSDFNAGKSGWTLADVRAGKVELEG